MQLRGNRFGAKTWTLQYPLFLLFSNHYKSSTFKLWMNASTWNISKSNYILATKAGPFCMTQNLIVLLFYDNFLTCFSQGYLQQINKILKVEWKEWQITQRDTSRFHQITKKKQKELHIRTHQITKNLNRITPQDLGGTK